MVNPADEGSTLSRVDTLLPLPPTARTLLSPAQLEGLERAPEAAESGSAAPPDEEVDLNHDMPLF